MRTTSDLARQFGLELYGSGSVALTAVALNTDHVVPGCLFIAAPGKNSHGLDHLALAVQRGAVAVLSDSGRELAIPNLFHPQPRAVAGSIAAEVFETETSNMSLYAVTGTNGKTSTVFYLAELLNLVGRSAGLISSALIRTVELELIPSLTTPEAPRVHQLLALMREHHQQSCAIEASAQGLTRNRLDGLKFGIAGFTNLSRDHLDDYLDLDSYLAEKARLFEPARCNRAVIFVEDDYARALLEKIEVPKVGIGFGCEYQYEHRAGSIELFGRHTLEINVEISALMAKNLVLAIVMLLEAGVEQRALEIAVSKMNTAVPGRLQRVSERGPATFVDYAHTPAAVLASAKELAETHTDLTVVLAASGDRDRGKRAEMGLAAAKYASRIIVTDQHPRSEDPAVIRADLKSLILDFVELEEVSDPALAIARAVEITDPGGAILWCGPGHLKYREIAGSKIMFDAVWEARRVLGHD